MLLMFLLGLVLGSKLGNNMNTIKVICDGKECERESKYIVNEDGDLEEIPVLRENEFFVQAIDGRNIIFKS